MEQSYFSPSIQTVGPHIEIKGDYWRLWNMLQSDRVLAARELSTANKRFNTIWQPVQELNTYFLTTPVPKRYPTIAVPAGLFLDLRIAVNQISVIDCPFVS